jgi:hypothetical protein
MVISARRPARRRLAVGLAAFGLLAASVMSGSTAIAEPPPAADVTAPVDIGDGRSIYLECAGSGEPTVILESGYHDSSDLWSLSDAQPPVAAEPVLPALARSNRVCAYDRPGTLRYTTDQASITDRSTPVPGPRTAADVVADLHALLQAAEVPAPYVFTAHSLGGLFARLYAQTHPDEVAGLVLVDTFSPEVPGIFGTKWSAYRELLGSTGTLGDPTAERIDLEASIDQLEQAPPLPAVPVVVLSKTEPFGGLPTTMPAGLTGEDIEQLWPQVQASVVQIAPQTPQIMATGSDHYIQVHQPDLVVAATQLVIARTEANA